MFAFHGAMEKLCHARMHGQKERADLGFNRRTARVEVGRSALVTEELWKHVDQAENLAMPDRKTLEGARKDRREGNRPHRRASSCAKRSKAVARRKRSAGA